MATTRQYWNALKNTRDAIAITMGTDVTMLQPGARAISNATLATVAIVVKALTDKGVISDAELTAARNAALGDVWDREKPTDEVTQL